MEPGIGTLPPGKNRKLYCPRCGKKNGIDVDFCAYCGQDLRLVTDAVRRRRGSPQHRRRLVVMGVLGVVLAGVLLLAFWRENAGRQLEQEMLLQHYLNGVWAAEVGRWDLAVEEFAAAGNFRDAPARRRNAERQLHEVEARYEAALEARDEGRVWESAFLLQQIVSVLPDYRSAQQYLAEARAILGPMLLFRQRPQGTALFTDVLLVTAEGGQEEPLTAAVSEAVDAAFSPNGAWVTYEVLRFGRTELWLASVASGETMLLVERADDVWTRWNREGNQLLYGWQGEQGWSLFLRDIDSLETQHLVRNADLATGQFSPSGAWVTLWVRRGNQWELLLASSSDLQRPRTLVQGADGIGLLDWIGSDEQLSYGYYLGGDWNLLLTNPDSAELLEVAPGAEYSWLRASPDGRAFALWRWQDQVGTLSFLAEPMGGEIPLVRGVADSWIRWSHDGRWLVAALWNGRVWRVELFPVTLTGQVGEPVRLADEVDDAEVEFSASGRYLLVRAWKDSRWSLHVRDLQENDERVLLTGATAVQSGWTPDEEHLLIWSVEEEEGAPPQKQLAVANITTGRRVTIQHDVHAAQVSFSRDGSRMSFAAETTAGSLGVWVADTQGSNLVAFDPSSYRAYWTDDTFVFGPRAPRPGSSS